MINWDKLKSNKIYCLDGENTFIDNDSYVNLALDENGIYVKLATIEEGHCHGSEVFDFYVVDNYGVCCEEYTIKTELEEISLLLSDEEELEYSDFGALIKRVDGEYKISYGSEFFDEFEEFSEYSEFDALETFLVKKMRNALKEYFNWCEVKKHYMESDWDLADKEVLYLFGVQYFIDEVKKEDINLAIDILKRYSDKKCMMQLKDCYLATNDMNSYLKTLDKIVSFHNVDIGDYIEYKCSFKGNWVEKREEIFKKHSHNYRFLNECYAYEKLYDKLMDNLKGKRELLKYTDILKKDFSNQLLEKYEKIVRDMAIKVSGRKTYREIVDILKIMQDIPDGENLVSDITDEFKSKYRRRRAMMEELNELSV